jgi:hypothetical protein
MRKAAAKEIAILFVFFIALPRDFLTESTVIKIKRQPPS